ncbi:MAG: hypothetical protein MSC30_14170 [Gaiellaceae bacterium MAG52_C11]|nr:hypothetical protein [Candidatus Gaiellasilicea maunaloa]
MFDYENPALLPLIKQLETELGGADRLRDRAREAVDYVSGVVWARLRRAPARVDHLRCITDACKDRPASVVSLNHDAVLERALRHDGVAFKDGFTVPVSGEIDAWSNDFDADVQLFKLHGPGAGRTWRTRSRACPNDRSRVGRYYGERREEADHRTDSSDRLANRIRAIRRPFRTVFGSGFLSGAA